MRGLAGGLLATGERRGAFRAYCNAWHNKRDEERQTSGVARTGLVLTIAALSMMHITVCSRSFTMADRGESGLRILRARAAIHRQGSDRNEAMDCVGPCACRIWGCDGGFVG